MTGDSADPFPGFTGLLGHVYPPGVTTSLGGEKPDNPFPIAEVAFYAQKNTFGKDETQDIVNRHGGLIGSAFWLVIDGLSRQAFTDLGVQVGAFTGSFVSLPGVQITPNSAGTNFQNGVHPKAPQRIRIPFDITLSQPVLDHFPALGASAVLDLGVSLTVGGATVSGSAANMEFELVAAGDPYFTNIDPAQNNEPYLSQDLRVFPAAPGINRTPIPGGPSFDDDSVAGAYRYIRDLLTYFNGNADFTNPQSASAADPFAALPAQQGEGQTDSSVAPYVVNSDGLIPTLENNYNFAVARVRLRGSAGAAGAASNVRVFFRVFASQSPDTDYDPNGTYAFTPDAAGLPGAPLPGVGQTTVPFFATGNSGVETDYQPGGPNVQTLNIPGTPAGQPVQDDVWWYFGCFLNFYDPKNTIAGQQVQTYLPGTHHCVVAQIAYDDAPIPAGMSPASWDQLAQRNLQFTAIDNPGPAVAHRAPQTFDIRPSPTIGSPEQAGLRPDELMIDWGGVPRGSMATIYWPAVAAEDVVALARTWRVAHGLSVSDAHTLTVMVEGGVSYIPIPTGTGQNFAGLFTLELPIGVKTGQTFDVLIRRISTASGEPAPPPAILHTPPSSTTKPRAELAVLVDPEMTARQRFWWRYVVGTFLVRIPVSTGKQMLVNEEMTLAIMKWRLANLSPGNRWTPVLQRYIAYCSARLDGIGGDSAVVPPSLTWKPTLPEASEPGSSPARQLCGKVVEVLFDCHGGIEGFVLDECCRQHVIHSSERGLADLILRACRDNFTVQVSCCSLTGRIERLSIRT